MAYTPLVYKTSGGDQLTVASGGVLELESGASLSLTGIAITTTGGIAGSSGTFTGSVAVTSGITGSSGAFTNGITGSSMAITNGITGSSLAITNGITGSSLAITNGITGSSLAITNGITGSSLAVTAGITGSSLAITNGITGSSATLTNGIAASTGTFTGAVAVTSGITALRYVNNTIAAASSGSTGFVSYGVSQVWSSGTDTGHVFTMPAAASVGIEKWIACIASTSTAPAVVSLADTLINGNATITFSSGSAGNPQWVHLMAENTTNWFVLGLSTGATAIP